VLGRDGTTPAAGLTIHVDSLITNQGRIQVRERLTTKTGRNGEYSLSGLYQGRVRVIVVEQGQEVMVRGEAVGDEIFLASGIDQRVNFDLSKAKPLAPAGAAAAPLPNPANEAEREALRKKIEADAAAAGEMQKSFEAGKVAFNEKRFDEAITLFKAAASKIPTPPGPGMDVIWANLGRALDAAKQYDEAMAAYQKAIDMKPKEPATLSNYYLNLSLIQMTAGKLEEGSASIKMAADLNPANAGVAYYNLGATLINRNKPKEAIEALKKSVELDPKYAPAHFQLGLTMIGQGQLQESHPYLQKVVELAPGTADAKTAQDLIAATKGPGTTGFSAPAPAGGAKAKGK
jgi:tetratricopeptide (TPR) repeat protein